MNSIIAIAIGGAIGALCRHYVGGWVAMHYPWPYGTTTVNLIGCFLIGGLLGAITLHPDSPQWVRLLFVTGGLGAFTTFSTFSWEGVQLIMNGSYGVAILYILGQLLGGLLLCTLGLVLSRLIFG